MNPTVLPFRGSVVRFVTENVSAAIYLRLALEISEGIGNVRECRAVPSHSGQPVAIRSSVAKCRERSSHRTGGARQQHDLPV